MNPHPYSNLSDTQFWSTGVKSPVSDQALLAIDPLIKSLSKCDAVVSGGSCFAQYIGKELTSRDFNYLRSELSDERVESFGLGNIYTIAQLRQWLEFSLDQREWSDECAYEENGQWFDYLIPHRDPATSIDKLYEHRQAVKDELLNHISTAKVLIFTIGLTEAWKNSFGDVYPICPGTLIGEFDKSRHIFHNYTFEEIKADLEVVETLLTNINPDIRLVFTVSPVPLTATATNEHVLLATTYSKSVIRAAIGQHCLQSKHSSYFPSYELISHHTEEDWRFSKNLRSVSESGVRYVMDHAFASNEAQRNAEVNADLSSAQLENQEAVCEEELLDSYSKSKTRAALDTDVFLVGDSHMGKLAAGFEAAGVEITGGMVMNGSGFSDGKFEMSKNSIFTPLENRESQEIWSRIHEKLVKKKGRCQIITNIGFQTHRTINQISNQLGTPVLTQADIAMYFEKSYTGQVHILQQLTQYGKVWLVEDPNFYAFIAGKDTAMTIRDKNFHQYCTYLNKIATNLGVEYLNPCDFVLSEQFKRTGVLNDLVDSDGFHGTRKYYDICATAIYSSISHDA